jgi:hypothetical protein
VSEDAVDDGRMVGAPEQGSEDGLAVLAAELEAASDLPLDERLALLKRAEEAIARSLEGLDGL